MSQCACVPLEMGEGHFFFFSNNREFKMRQFAIKVPCQKGRIESRARKTTRQYENFRATSSRPNAPRSRGGRRGERVRRKRLVRGSRKYDRPVGGTSGGGTTSKDCSLRRTPRRRTRGARADYFQRETHPPPPRGRDFSTLHITYATTAPPAAVPHAAIPPRRWFQLRL